MHSVTDSDQVPAVLAEEQLGLATLASKDASLEGSPLEGVEFRDLTDRSSLRRTEPRKVGLGDMCRGMTRRLLLEFHTP
jgi:hypothetical protein